MQPSRRAFLTVGRLFGDSWGRFYQRLARSVQGRLEDQTPGRSAPGNAWLQPARQADVHHARALCAQAGIVVVLDGCPAPAERPVLRIDPSRLNDIQRAPGGALVAEAGARVLDIRRHMPDACMGAADDAMLAQWLTAPVVMDAAPLGKVLAGLADVEVLLASGTTEVFGPFGASSRRPALRGDSRALVSQMFTLVNQPAIAAWRRATTWPARYRLDALFAQPPNLAYMLAGSMGTLAWFERIRFDPGLAPLECPGEPSEPAPNDFPASAIRHFEARVKRAFDPGGVFPDLPVVPVV